MDKTQLMELKDAAADTRELVDKLLKEFHDDMDAFPEGSNIRRCLTKGIDNLDDAERWLRAVIREGL